MHDHMTLTAAQRDAVAHRDGPLLVVAGPGSGKTAVIAHRAAALVAAGVAPGSLLVVTFTRAAAGEMQQRALALTPAARAATFCTFHALAYRILRTARPGGPQRILEEEHQFKMLRGLLKGAGLPADEEAVLTLQAELGCHANCADPAAYVTRAYSPADFAALGQAYRAEKARRGVLDFDDLQLECLAELKASDRLLEGLRQRYHYLMADEFQDTNRAQWELLQLLAEPRNNVCAVGDDDQAIYGWRGASPRYLLDFGRHFPGCRLVKLEVNHRSPAPVLAAAAKLIRHNGERYAKAIRPGAHAAGAGPQVLFPADSVGEAAAALERIAAARSSGRRWADCAVLYRTHDQAHALVQALDRASIPYRALGGRPNLYRRWPAQDVLAYLRLAAGSGDFAALAQVVNRPGRYISRRALAAGEAAWRPDNTGDPLAALAGCDELERWQTERLQELGDQLRRVRTMQAPAAIGYVRRIIGYDDYIREFAERRGGPVDDLLGLLAELELTALPAGLPEFLAHVESYAAGRTRTQEADEDGDAVTLATCHKAKGLEFPVVILIGAADGLMPLRGGDPEEERRLFYVAMTRAMAELHISAPGAWEGKERRPSPFLAEAGLAVPAGSPAAEAPAPAAPEPAAEQGSGAADVPLQAGVLVYHARHGRGRVESVDHAGDRVTIDFAGNRLSLSLTWCLGTPAFFRTLPRS